MTKRRTAAGRKGVRDALASRAGLGRLVTCRRRRRRDSVTNRDGGRRPSPGWRVEYSSQLARRGACDQTGEGGAREAAGRCGRRPARAARPMVTGSRDRVGSPVTKPDVFTESRARGGTSVNSGGTWGSRETDRPAWSVGSCSTRPESTAARLLQPGRPADRQRQADSRAAMPLPRPARNISWFICPKCLISETKVVYFGIEIFVDLAQVACV